MISFSSISKKFKFWPRKDSQRKEKERGKSKKKKVRKEKTQKSKSSRPYWNEKNKKEHYLMKNTK